MSEPPNNQEPKFPSREAYLEWCAEQCQKIKTSCIAMNNDGIKEVVFEIDRKLYLTDYQELHAERGRPAITDRRMNDMTEEEKMRVFRNSVQLGSRLRMPESECVGDSSATSCSPAHPKTPPAAGRPRSPDTRRCACGNQLMVREDRRTGRCGVCRWAEAPVSEGGTTERSGEQQSHRNKSSGKQ